MAGAAAIARAVPGESGDVAGDGTDESGPDCPAWGGGVFSLMTMGRRVSYAKRWNWVHYPSARRSVANYRADPLPTQNGASSYNRLHMGRRGNASPVAAAPIRVVRANCNGAAQPASFASTRHPWLPISFRFRRSPASPPIWHKAAR